MATFARYTDEARDAINSKDYAKLADLMDANFKCVFHLLSHSLLD